MRADRLLSILMLLQSRGQLSARELAAELAVSERTIYRDIDALSASGVPVYAETGRDGGYGLLDSYRTSLTGLTDGEVRALFMLSVPGPLTQLGVSQELRAALHKLEAALPKSRRQDEEWVRRRFHLDATWWHQRETPVPFLRVVHQAVWTDRKLRIVHRQPVGVTIEQVVDAYALVAKAGSWYLVCAYGGRMRVHNVADLLDVEVTGDGFERDLRFSPAAFWADWCAAREADHARYAVTVRVAPHFVLYLPWYFGHSIHQRIAEAAPPDEDGRITLTLTFESLEAARDRLLDLGNGVEVIEPIALRLSIADYAKQISALYADDLVATSAVDTSPNTSNIVSAT
ncbi:MAG: YafY family transcriptional regulator [Caldilineaceae bacterium]|nr:YafY family transcriptional regulator [Caldilineaceae bacterium]